jgi:hypothetical protein
MTKRSWLKIAIPVVILYILVGVAFGAFANSAPTRNATAIWRIAAWLVSACAYSMQILYEHFRHRSAPVTIAWHACIAAAAGAFALAIAARVHAMITGLGNQQLLTLALVLWPLFTAIPAFLVAWMFSRVLVKFRPSGKSTGR